MLLRSSYYVILRCKANRIKMVSTSIHAFLSSVLLSLDPLARLKEGSSLPVLDVLYQSEKIAVVSKPPNVPVHHLELRSKQGKRKRIVKDADVVPVLELAEATFPDRDMIHLVHRLDSPTSGCLILAFSSESAREAAEALSEGQKTYYALCRGNGESLKKRGVIQADGNVKDSRGRIKEGALTEMECLFGTDGPPRRCCLVRCIPHTGFFHQIRQHVAREHHPIVGENRHHPDRKENRFWREESGLLPQSRIFLHCHRIVLQNVGGKFRCIPKDGLDVCCPLPQDMKTVIDLTSFGSEASALLDH